MISLLGVVNGSEYRRTASDTHIVNITMNRNNIMKDGDETKRCPVVYCVPKLCLQILHLEKSVAQAE